jgi:DNA polymerase-4
MEWQGPNTDLSEEEYLKWLSETAKPKDDESKAYHVYQNSTTINNASIVMYIDMNSFFASCEQQRNPELRGKAIGVVTYDSPNACVIAPSIEAKKFGVKTGMRLTECRQYCPHIIPVTTHPAWYRQIHVDIIAILRKYCDDVIAKSIDEAVMNMTSYRLVYKDLKVIGRQIKADIKEKYDYLTCSIGIAPNSFLAKVATELQKPDGLIEITPENIDTHLATMKLQDLPGIASRNERRLVMVGIKSPLEMRHSSAALLRKAFGGIVGQYWHHRLNFGEVDMYSNENRTMSATRTVSRAMRESQGTLEALLVSLCTRLEQRMVKQKVFCKEASFFIRYINNTGWDTKVSFSRPVQDANELRHHLLERIHDFEKKNRMNTMFNTQTRQLGVGIQNFVGMEGMPYSLFDNRMQQDVVRRVMYEIKDKYGKNKVRKGVEMFDPFVMKDAIGFGSVRDMVMVRNGENEDEVRNKYLLEEDDY